MASKYSIGVNGKRLSLRWKRRVNDDYRFYLGDNLVGVVYNMGKYWSCHSWIPHELGVINGMATRFDASWLLLKMNGYVD